MKAYILASLLAIVVSAAQAEAPAKVGDACKIGPTGVQFSADASGRWRLRCNPQSLVWEEMGTTSQAEAVLAELVMLNATNQQLLAQQIEANKVQKMILQELINARTKAK